MFMSRLLLAAALSLPMASLPAASLGSCPVRSDFKVQRDDGGYRFTRGASSNVLVRNGNLVVNGAPVALSADDRARLKRFQADLDSVIEEARGLGMEATALAIDAVSEVALAFFGDDPATLNRFEQRLGQLDADIRASLATGDGALFDERAFSRAIESAMSELAPMLAGRVAAKAVAAALSGDDAGIRDIEARASRLEHEIEARVKARARDLEARADALCPQIESMAATLASMDYRNHDGSPLGLIRSRR